MLSEKNARLAAARGLTGPRARREAGRFLAEGAQAVREALLAGAVEELFVTAEAAERHPDLLVAAPAGLVSLISPKAAAGLSETVHPQGLVAVCRPATPTLAQVLAAGPRLLAMLVEVNDPGNAGTILRTADAAGAEAVLLAGAAVDPYNGKAVRASAGSIFHLGVVSGLDPVAAIADCRAAGLLTAATTGAGTSDLDQLADAGTLDVPVVWIFGNEARGLPAEVLAAADLTVRVPLHGRAESLNLAAAAAVCLYTTAREQHRRP